MPDPVRFLRENIMSGELSDIELVGVAYDETLNRPGSLSAVMSLRSEYATEETLDPWRTALYVVRGTNVEWGGILTPPSLQTGSDALSLTAFGWLGYWDHRVIRSTVGQPEAGGQITAKPIDDSGDSHVGAVPVGSTMWQNIAGGYSVNIGLAPDVGEVGTWLGHFSVPTAGLTLHPIASVTVGLVMTGVGAPNACAPILRIGGNTYQPGGTVVNPGQIQDLSHTWTLNPATGLAWQPADVYAFAASDTAGVLTSVAGTFVDVIVNQIWMTVTYQTGFTDFFAQTDQFDIFRALVHDAQDQTKWGLDYDLGISVTWDTISGVVRDRLVGYQSHLAKNLGEELRRLGALEHGFDFAMGYTLNAATDRIDKTIRLTYPSQGRQTGFLFEYEPPSKTNVLSRGFADPVNFAWTGDGWGSGNDVTRLRSPYINETLRGVYPPYDAAPAWSSVVEQATLDEHTIAAFTRTSLPNRIPILRVDPDLFPQWGDYTLGDEVNVRIRDGYGSTVNNVPQRVRISGWKVDVDSNTYDLVLGDPLGDAPSGEVA